MSPLRAIIFGASGAVGKAAAAEAYRRGAHVTIALRNTLKSTPGLTDLPRVQADLTDVDSVKSAVRQANATVAFVYTMDDMKPTFEALKEAGISYVVILSSWTIYPKTLEEAAEWHVIPAKHAKAEIALRDSGLKYSAIRPLYFATNVAFEGDGIQRGQIDVLNPDGVWDYIAPEDIGVVAAAKLFSKPEIVDIMGPDLITQRTAWRIIGEELGRDIKVNEVTFDDFIKKSPIPEQFSRSLALGTIRTDKEKYPAERCKIALENVRKYAEREPMKFSSWVKQHREDFSR